MLWGEGKESYLGRDVLCHYALIAWSGRLLYFVRACPTSLRDRLRSVQPGLAWLGLA